MGFNLYPRCDVDLAVLPERILSKVTRTQQKYPESKHKITVEVLENSTIKLEDGRGKVNGLFVQKKHTARVLTGIERGSS
jgi:hypothetical protein